MRASAICIEVTERFVDMSCVCARIQLGWSH